MHQEITEEMIGRVMGYEYKWNVIPITTSHGNTLEVGFTLDPKHQDRFLFDFILREKKPHGENVRVLRLRVPLTNPTYFIAEYVNNY